MTLYANPSTVVQGGTIKVTGNKYNSASTFGPVEIRLDSRTAPVLASAVPVSGNISVDVTIPAKTAVGYHILIATQYNKTTGVPCTGCPGRTTIKVVAPVTASSASVAGGGGNLIAPFGVPGFFLASLAGFAVRRHRRRSVAATA